MGPDFHVMGELGRGGFAVVYLVEDRNAQRHLAVKVMRRELMIAPLLVERLAAEIADEGRWRELLRETIEEDDGARLRVELPDEIDRAQLLPLQIAYHLLAETLDDERRAALIAFIEANKAIPADVKKRLITALNRPEVPARMIERLQSRMGG